MESIQLRRNFSRNTLIRMFILAALGLALLVWKFDFINSVYFRDQLTATGMLINGTILVLFLLGLLRIIGILLRYSREESAIRRVIENLEEGVSPLLEVPKARIISHRYQTMETLHNSSTPINHNALASTLVATESTRSSFPRFINNILILTGVFGTIVSLSIALIGASDLLGSAVNTDGMGLVIHGMSTALSTTITAIVCYLYFGYFYLKLNDVQTNLIGGVEQVTAQYLVPRFQVEAGNILYEFSGLIRSLQSLVNQIENSQHSFEAIQQHLVNTLDTYSSKVHSLSDDMGALKHLLRTGFRLPTDE